VKTLTPTLSRKREREKKEALSLQGEGAERSEAGEGGE